MDLPSEIVLPILSYLARPDLKSTRLVSEHWSLCAAEFLFDVIYISPSREDVDVFQAITQHPVLSKCPRHLEYFGTEFSTHYSKDEYAEIFWEQTLLVLYSYRAGSGEQWVDPDAEINAWIKETVLPNSHSQFKDIENLSNCRIVNDGYRKYQEHAKYQRDMLDGLQCSQFAEILGKGLQHLPSLASVALQSDWTSNAKYACRDIRSGSPLARSWHVFYPEPRRWFHGSFEDQWKGPDRAQHYLIISSALARARKRIRKFKVGQSWCMDGGLSHEVFNNSDHWNTASGIAAFSGLEHCDIMFASYRARNDYKVPENNVNNIQLLLASMEQLGYLSLKLPYPDQSQRLYTCEMVFSAVKIWSRLTTLELDFVSTTATELLQLLVFQMPKMRHLELGGINLLKGTWHSVIEGLKQSNRLSSFHISPGTSLLHRGGVIFMRCNSRFLSAVRNYIVHGGHHPCILPNEPSHAAQGYMVDIEISVRDRLGKLDSMRSEDLDSLTRKAWMDVVPKRSKFKRKFDHFDGSQACWERLVEIEKDHFPHQRSSFTF